MEGGKALKEENSLKHGNEIKELYFEKWNGLASLVFWGQGLNVFIWTQKELTALLDFSKSCWIDLASQKQLGNIW